VIWASWRQFRSQGAVALVVLAVIAVILAVTGAHLVHVYSTTIAPCKAHGDCKNLTANFTSSYGFLQDLGTVLVVVPGFVGVFWGAPLVARELEAGTFRLAWTQSFSRSRWLTAKVGLVGLASVAVTGLFSLMLTWWSSPIDRVKMSPFTFFDHRDIVPIGYAAFAFALGVTTGVLIRRTLPAMAVTLVGFVAVRTFIAHSVRTHFARPITLSQRLNARDAICSGAGCPPLRSGEFVLSNSLVNASGHAVNNIGCSDGVRVTRGSTPPSPAAIQHAYQVCLSQYRQVQVYQPDSRYWPFQWYETAIFVGLALILIGFSFWRVRRHLS
jgi:hypothetical protein